MRGYVGVAAAATLYWLRGSGSYEEICREASGGRLFWPLDLLSRKQTYARILLQWSRNQVNESWRVSPDILIVSVPGLLYAYSFVCFHLSAGSALGVVGGRGSCLVLRAIATSVSSP